MDIFIAQHFYLYFEHARANLKSNFIKNESNEGDIVRAKLIKRKISNEKINDREKLK